MTLIRTSYKLLADPMTFDFFVCENQLHSQENTDVRRLETRKIENDELATWTKQQFLERMEEGGYGTFARSYLERNAITFSCGSLS